MKIKKIMLSNHSIKYKMKYIEELIKTGLNE